MSRRISEYVEHQAYVAGAEDRAGNTIDGWGAANSVGIYAFDPGSSSEPREAGHDRVIVEPTLYTPSTVVFDHRDKVTARGHLFEVEGDTREWRHTDGTRKGNVISLRRVDG